MAVLCKPGMLLGQSLILQATLCMLKGVKEVAPSQVMLVDLEDVTSLPISTVMVRLLRPLCTIFVEPAKFVEI